MPSSLKRNIELKAQYADLDRAREICKNLGARFDRAMEQLDTYFHSPNGRLKLREYGSSAELIWYDRLDATEYRGSNYLVVPVPDPALLKSTLTAACGLRGEVRKRREVFLFHNVRIHLDRVDRLGCFIEFEAVMTEGEDDATSLRRLDELRAVLEIRPEDRERGSYADLLGI